MRAKAEELNTIIQELQRQHTFLRETFRKEEADKLVVLSKIPSSSVNCLACF